VTLASEEQQASESETSIMTVLHHAPGGIAAFNLEEFFPRAIMAAITDVRVEEPDLILERARARARRGTMTTNGRLMIVAADHTAHHDARVGSDALAMTNRHYLYGRLLRALVSPEVDGVLATPDVIEDLLIVDALLVRKGLAPILDHKVLVGTLNPAGLGGSSWELNSPVTSYTPRHIIQLRLDAGKMLMRADLDNADTLPTLAAAAQAVNDLTDAGLATYIEPIPIKTVDGSFKVQKRADALAPLVNVCSALGGSSRRTWLKVPYCSDFSTVAKASTLPMLMLGGASLENPIPMLEEFVTGMAAGTNVRGAMVGRNVLFPGDVDPQLVARAVSRIVHRSYTVDQAIELMRTGSAEGVDAFSGL
jgi:DhnA family fructose-bisphosphate aldolase class Ia